MLGVTTASRDAAVSRHSCVIEVGRRRTVLRPDTPSRQAGHRLDQGIGSVRASPRPRSRSTRPGRGLGREQRRVHLPGVRHGVPRQPDAPPQRAGLSWVRAVARRGDRRSQVGRHRLDREQLTDTRRAAPPRCRRGAQERSPPRSSTKSDGLIFVERDRGLPGWKASATAAEPRSVLGGPFAAMQRRLLAAASSSRRTVQHASRAP